MKFIRGSNRGNFYLSSKSFEIWWFIRGMEVCSVKFSVEIQHNISKITPAGQKKQGHGVLEKPIKFLSCHTNIEISYIVTYNFPQEHTLM